MIDRRQVVLVAALLASLALVSNTAAYSSVHADRGVQVQVVGDEDAYLGLQRTTTNASNGTADLDVTVSNQFAAGTDLTEIETSVDGTAVDLASGGSLAPGETSSHTFANVSCGDAVAIDASGSGVRVSLKRSVPCGNTSLTTEETTNETT
ncbi:hypothetical protein D3D02_08810 [Halobellus sp. Atlit-38R]|uniref:hypothetical protein n=1 Tax=Halobellus sp. Atlit-38R TaxID=2282131 RepID=UPI000EF1B301|nr:hypothetical protein [Halobellus sp. Atlit-38R]RLM89217.1 hypothetical protein D3D02_08810 [Halobellus sp. Atlit-38R]